MNVKFGTVMGANLAVACVLMQGCKAPQAGAPSAEPAPAAVAPAKPVATAKPAAAKPAADKPAAAKPVESVEVVEQPATPASKPAAAEPETTTYVVRRGDYLAKICKTYNIKMSAVLKANPGLNADKIRIGQKIKLPGKVDVQPEPQPASVAPAKKPAAKPSSKPAAKSAYAPYTGATKEYVVKNGDMLGSIALAHGISVRALKELNGLEEGPKGNALKVNQKLKVPAEKVVAPAAKAEKKSAAEADPAEVKPAAAPETQKPEANPAEAVAPAEAAPAEAEKAKNSTAQQVDEIQKNLETPAAAPEANGATTTYVVGPNDDLVAISISTSVSPSLILDLNNLPGADAIKPGMVLKIPVEKDSGKAQ